MSSPLQQDKEYTKSLNILNQLDKGDLNEGLFACFAVSRRSEVVWFDQVGSPYGVAIQGAALVKTRLLNLPNQQMQVISLEEAYQQLLRNHQQQYLTVLANLKFENSHGGGSGWALLLLIGLGLALMLLVFKPFDSSSRINVNRDVKIVNTGQYSPIGDPTISRTNFKNFLKELNSPALSEGDAMYDACLNEGCDPALALAFFEHESSGGNQGAAAVTKSIGNIRCSPGYTCYTTNGNGSFRQYNNWTESVRDWSRLLKVYRDIYNKRTLEEIVPMYAPQSDNNDEKGYIAAVKKRVDDLRQREFSLH